MRQTLTYTAGIIHRHRAQIDSPWRKLSPTQRAPLVLAYPPKAETFAELAAGFGIDTVTAWIRSILRELAASGLAVLADKGYTGGSDQHPHPYKGRSKPHASEGRRPRPHPAARPWRTGQRPAQDLAQPAQTPPLTLDGRQPRQGIHVLQSQEVGG